MDSDIIPDRDNIIAALAKASGPAPQLEAEMTALRCHALLRPYPPQTDFGPGAKWQFWSLDGFHFLGNESKFKVPPVTSSVDCALASAPDGTFATFDPHFLDPHDLGDRGGVRFMGYAFRPDWKRWGPLSSQTDWLNRVEGPLCATPALAICAVLLLAEELETA
jgi:hypothetical protein